MAKIVKLLSQEEMCQHYRTEPVWIEQLRAKISKGMGDGKGIVRSWCKDVRPGERFHQKVRAFGRGELSYLDTWEMLKLFSVIYDLDPPRITQVLDGRMKNGRADFGVRGVRARRRLKSEDPADHPALRDL